MTGEQHKFRVSPSGRQFIKKWEGLRLRPYVCAGGWLTVGYGHAISPASKQMIARAKISGITMSEAQNYFEADIRSVESAISRLISRPLTQSQVDALASFTFNLGAGALQRSTLRMRINRGEAHSRCASEFPKWVMAGGRRVRGLVLRRRAERAVYLSPSSLVQTDESRDADVETAARVGPWWRRALDYIIGGVA